MLKGHSVSCGEMKGPVQSTCRVSFKKGIIKFCPLVQRYDNGVKTMSVGGHMLVEEEMVAQGSLIVELFNNTSSISIRVVAAQIGVSRMPV